MNYTPHSGAMVLTALLCSSPAQAQCPPQRLDPDAGGSDFGYAVAMDDRHLIVGDRHDHSMCTFDPSCANGKVYAYQRGVAGQWAFTQELRPAALAPFFAFGASVDIDGDRVLVGAPAYGAGVGLGAAFVFEFDGEEWVEAAELRGTMGLRDFGETVAISGDMALATSAGEYVYVYLYDGERWTWVETHQSPDSPDVHSAFGKSIDIDGAHVVIAADVERVLAPNGGAVYLYRRLPGGRLEFAQKLLAPDVMSGPRFGSSVSLDGDRLAVGCELGRRGLTAQGVVYVHELVDGRWELAEELVAEEPAEIARFGRAVLLSGDRLAIGAPTQRQPDRSGAAFVFERGTGGTWTQKAQFLPEAWQIDFGHQVGMGAGDLAVGAPRTQVAGEEHGSVSIFDLSCLLCKPDLDADGALTVFDFLLFLNLFQDADPLADFDGDGELTIFDFLAFQTSFDAGCA